MAHKHDSIPRSDAEFNSYFDNIRHYVGQKTGGQPPEWPNVPAGDRQELNGAWAEWTAAYTPTLQAHLPAQTAEKNRVRTAAERVLRAFIKQFLRFAPVTDYDRDMMNIPNPDLIRTNIGRPAEHVELVIEPHKDFELAVQYRVLETGSKAVPYGYSGVVLRWKVLEDGEEVPADGLTLPESILLTSAPYIHVFPGHLRGRRVAYCAVWQNRKGEAGDPCPVQVHVVP